MYYSLVYFRRGSYLDLRRPRCPRCREGDRKWASESLREAKPYLSSSPLPRLSACEGALSSASVPASFPSPRQKDDRSEIHNSSRDQTGESESRSEFHARG